MNMKNTLKYIALSVVVMLGAASCEKFLDRPAEDSYNSQNFYQDASQCIQGVNYLYNSPWSDAYRGFYFAGEAFSGNYYDGGMAAPFMTFTVNGSDQYLRLMSASLWSVNAHAAVVYYRLKDADASIETRNMCMGEALTWKAMAYFFLARTFGDVPIIHNVSSEIAAGNYASIYKAPKAQVYEYTCMLLEEAMKLLPKKVANKDGRIDYYSAEALLAKVYLQKAGVSGSLNQDDLDKAAAYAKDVIEHSGRTLMPEYSDIFRLQNNKNIEALISWHWDASAEPWTAQNMFQCDLAPKGFDEFGDCWGQWTGPTVELQDQFGVSALDNPADRVDLDTRRKATMMLPGDKYDYFWTTNGGFDVLRFYYDPSYGPSGSTNASEGSLNYPTGAGCVKFLYGDGNDHFAALGVSAGRMSSGLSTHILRLADVYLLYCEAKLHGPGSSTSDALALQCYNAVRNRAIPTADSHVSSITFEQIFAERNLELALEGDRWYDFVRVGYYNPDFVVNQIQGQRRGKYNGKFNTVCKNYYKEGLWSLDYVDEDDDSAGTITYDAGTIPTRNAILNIVSALPFPSEDVVFNPNLLEEAREFDLSTITF